MIPNIFFTYVSLALEGKVEDIQCPDSHGTLYAFIDLDKDRVALECVGCSYKLYPGLDMYDKMKRDVYSHGVFE
jgi:hypothetical protein